MESERRGACLACGGPLHERVRRYRTHTRHGREIFAGRWIRRCRRCDLAQIDPAPSGDALTRYYTEDYRTRGYAGSDVADVARFPDDNLFYRNRGRSIVELLRPWIETQTPKVLDVGAGYGHILYAFREDFPQATLDACEPSEVCRPFLNKIGASQSADLPAALTDRGGHYDVAVLSHVFEHLLDPKQTLDAIREGLTARGLLYIEVPNVPAEALTGYPDHVWAPRFDEPHVTFWNPADLRRSLEENGFDILFCETAGPLYRWISAARFHLPHGRWLAQSLLPSRIFHVLRGLRATEALRVSTREPSFRQYGGARLWIRVVARRR